MASVLCLIPSLAIGSLAAAADFSAPPPRMLELLRREHHPGHRLITIISSSRLDLTALGASNERHNNDTGAIIGGNAVGIVDGGNGGRLGDRSATLTSQYAATEDRSPVRTTDAKELVIADLRPLRPKVSPQDVVRLFGAFGEFTGRVSSIADGVVSLERVTGLDPSLPAPGERIAWDEITRVDRRGKSSRDLATSGATVLGITAGALAVWVSVALGNESRDVTSAFVFGSMAGSLAGAGAGALIGAFIPSWHCLFDRSTDDRESL